MKKLTSIIAALLLCALPLMGAQVSSSISGASTNSLLSEGVAITKVTLANSSGAAATVHFVDAPSTDLTYTVGAYTNVTIAVSNIVSTYTSITGFSVTNTNTLVTHTTNVTAASTNNYRSLLTLVVPDGQTVTYTPTVSLIGFQGVLSTNSTNIDITLDYVPLR